MKYLFIELKRMFLTRSFWISMLITSIICIAQYISYGFLRGDAYGDWIKQFGPNFMIQPNSLYSSWIGGELNSAFLFLFLAILPMLAAFSYSLTYWSDKKTGQIKNVLVRESHGNYYRSKWIAVFIGGFLIALLPLVLNIYLHLTYAIPLTPILESYTAEVGFSNQKWIFDLFYLAPALYVAMYVLVIALFSGVFATLGLFSSLIVPKGIVAVIGPFLIWRGTDLFCSLIGKPSWGLTTQLSPALGHLNFIVVGVYLILFLGLSTIPFGIQCLRKADF